MGRGGLVVSTQDVSEAVAGAFIISRDVTGVHISAGT